MAVAVRAVTLVALGGAVGSVLRLLVTTYVARGSLPWGVAAVNLVGSFLAGLLLFGALERGWFGIEGQEFLVVGLLGGFTTMSAFAVDTAALAAQGSWWRMAANLLVNPVLSVLGALLGRAAALGGLTAS